ncbi:MAG: hypothetical protein JWO59_2184 [Chloroflexi bacterium]|nr:hypothetical protein [Chloroflexota bacterium]
MQYATTALCTPAVGRRAGAAHGSAAVVRCVYFAPRPEHPGQRPGRAGATDCPRPGLRAPDGARRDRRLPCHRPCRVAARVLGAPYPAAPGDAAGAVSRGRPYSPCWPRAGVRWLWAKRWLSSPDPEYARKKTQRDRLIRLAQAQPAWVLGFEDERWWSRVAQQSVARDRLLDPKALACYSLVVRAWDGAGQRHEDTWLRCVDGRPVSAITTQFLACCCARLQARGTTTLLLVWDNAYWHRSQAVRRWLSAHNQQVKATGQGVRIVRCPLPRKSPWLNPNEPKWTRGKRKVTEASRPSPAMSWPTACTPPWAAPVNLICVFLMQLPDYALGTRIVQKRSLLTVHFKQ